MKHKKMLAFPIIKKLSVFLLLLIICTWTAAAAARAAYVSDILRLALRTGPGAGYETVTVIQSGQSLEIIATEGDWAQVKLPDNREGWVLQRYLVPNRTSNILLRALEQKHAALSEQTASLLEENKDLKNQNITLQTELDQIEKRADKVTQDYESFKQEAAQYLKLKTQHQKTASQLAKVSKQAAELQEKVDTAKTRQTIRWFITGAGVLFVGILIGLSTRRQRRRPSLL